MRGEHVGEMFPAVAVALDPFALDLARVLAWVVLVTGADDFDFTVGEPRIVLQEELDQPKRLLVFLGIGVLFVLFVFVPAGVPEFINPVLFAFLSWVGIRDEEMLPLLQVTHAKLHHRRCEYPWGFEKTELAEPDATPSGAFEDG